MTTPASRNQQIIADHSSDVQSSSPESISAPIPSQMQSNTAAAYFSPAPATLQQSVAPFPLPFVPSLPITQPSTSNQTPATSTQLSYGDKETPASRSPSPFSPPLAATQYEISPASAVRDQHERILVVSRAVRSTTNLPHKAPISKRRNGKITSHKGQPGRKGSGFSEGELENLLELLEMYLPLGKGEWEKVTRLHESRYPSHRRNADSLRRKFSSLCRTTFPTGDLNILHEVLKAKQIREQMTERADIGYGAESDDEYTDNISDDTPTIGQTTINRGVDGAFGILETKNSSPSVSNSENADQAVTPCPRPLVCKKNFLTLRKRTKQTA